MSYGRGKGRGRPSSACGHRQSRSSGRSAMTVMSSSRSRPMFSANTPNTSAWVTPSPSSTPASVSVTRASGRVAERELAGQNGLGVAGHADQRPALGGVPLRLGPGGEPRALDDHERPRRPPAPSPPLGGQSATARPAGQYGSANGTCTRALVVVRLRPARGPVHELVRHHQRARTVGRGQRADRAGREDLADADRAQRPQVRPVGDPVRREPVVAAVPGQERHPAPGDLAE